MFFNSISSNRLRNRWGLLISLGTLIPLGFIVRSYQGGTNWWNDWGGGVLYEIFWVVFLVLLLPRIRVQWIAIGVCLVTCALEFLQLWQPPLLQAIRATFPGRLLLGNTFNWFDFPPYFIGSFLGWLWILVLQKPKRTSLTP